MRLQQGWHYSRRSITSRDLSLMARGHLGSVVAFLRRATGSAGSGESTDGALLEQFTRHNDEAAFAELVGRHGPMVLAVCLRILGDAHAAEDAFQATFLILARKAGSVRRPDGVGCWLHSIAVRVSRKMRAGGLRRRECAALVEAEDGNDPVAEAALKELGTLLDEELGRLPETYRAPLILCYLEGRTNDEAARELGWPRGTVSGRLARARDLLRGRLARRGLALSGGALASLLAGSAARAGVPPALAGATVRAAAGFAAGAVAATPAVILAQGVLETMFVVKLKFAAC